MILIGLGSNLHHEAFGSPRQTIENALALMQYNGICVKAVSPFCHSAPVPYSSCQPWFWNAVAQVNTSLSPQELMATLLEIEHFFGRTRSEPNASRTLDLDLLDYDGLILKEEGLELPHPRMTQRAFVLRPLQSIAPKWVDPVSGKQISQLITDLKGDQHVVLLDVDHEHSKAVFTPYCIPGGPTALKI